MKLVVCFLLLLLTFPAFTQNNWGDAYEQDFRKFKVKRMVVNEFDKETFEFDTWGRIIQRHSSRGLFKTIDFYTYYTYDSLDRTISEIQSYVSSFKSHSSTFFDSLKYIYFSDSLVLGTLVSATLVEEDSIIYYSEKSFYKDLKRGDTLIHTEYDTNNQLTDSVIRINQGLDEIEFKYIIPFRMQNVPNDHPSGPYNFDLSLHKFDTNGNEVLRALGEITTVMIYDSLNRQASIIEYKIAPSLQLIESETLYEDKTPNKMTAFHYVNNQIVIIFYFEDYNKHLNTYNELKVEKAKIKYNNLGLIKKIKINGVSTKRYTAMLKDLPAVKSQKQNLFSKRHDTFHYRYDYY